MAVTTGHLANFTVGASDRWEELDGQCHIFNVEIAQEAIESTVFDGGTILGRTYYQGMAECSGSIEAHYPDDAIFGGGAMTDSNAQDLAAGTAQSTLTFTSETGKNIVVEAQLFNISIKLNRRTGLVDLTADFSGDITSAA